MPLRSLLADCFSLRRLVPLGIFAFFVPVLSADAVATESPKTQEKAVADFGKDVLPFLTKHCTSCHGAEKPKGGINLAKFTDENVVNQNRKAWRKVLENVESGDMPPEGKPHPSQDEIASLVSWSTARLDVVDCAKEVDPGRVTIRRLNRAEYNNTIRDLIGIDFKPADDFPSDDVGYGFDNIGDVLTLPPLLLEKYMAAAEQIADRAIESGVPRTPDTKSWDAESLSGEIAGSPFEDWGRVLGFESEITMPYAFPRDAEYVLRMRAAGQQAGADPVRVAFKIDGKVVQTVDVTATEDSPQVYEVKARVEAGNRTLAIAFLNDFWDPKVEDPKRRDRNFIVDYIEVYGPLYDPKGPLPESHKKIIFRKPTPETRGECAQQIIERFVSRAYRRPAAAGEVGRLIKFVDLAEQNGDSFERGIQLAVQAVLVSPQFLFRVELDRRPKKGDKDASGSHPINDFELASRLSYFLWSSMPDEELYQLALNKKLREGDTLEKQTRRMLRDPKAKALVENFADQWLQIRNLKTISPDLGRFPTFDEPLRWAMLRETELFFEAVLREDRSLLDFLDADFSFVNERLAKHYGLESVQGAEFRRVKFRPGDHRGGVLTHASVLAVTSNPTRTSPVKRGKWILEQVLGTPPPPPPPNVPDLKDEKETKLSGSLRQRMEQHRANPSCAACHARMDPLGFGFENYDAIGAWREKDGEFPVDPSGLLPSGQSFKGPDGLKAILKSKEKEFVRCVSEKMLTYALGRGVEEADQCVMDRIVDAMARDHHKFSTLVIEIVKSEPFQRRKNRGG